MRARAKAPERPEDKFIRRVNEIVSGADVMPQLLQTIDEQRETIAALNAHITRLETELAKYKAQLQAGVLIEPRQIVTTTQVFCDYMCL